MTQSASARFPVIRETPGGVAAPQRSRDLERRTSTSCCAVRRRLHTSVIGLTFRQLWRKVDRHKRRKPVTAPARPILGTSGSQTETSNELRNDRMAGCRVPACFTGPAS
jgi:hypothetical protein